MDKKNPAQIQFSEINPIPFSETHHIFKMYFRMLWVIARHRIYIIQCHLNMFNIKIEIMLTLNSLFESKVIWYQIWWID